MHGIVFNLLEHVVTEEHGEAAWDDLLARAGAAGCWTAVGSYPDADLMRLLEALPGAAERGRDETLRAFGCAAMGRLSVLYPQFFAPHERTTPFLLTLNDIIHPAVRCLYPGADVPVFDVDLDLDVAGDGSRLVLGYRSGRRLCHLAEGFVAGAAAHFGERVALAQTQCMLDGAPTCLLTLAFTPLSAPLPAPSTSRAVPSRHAVPAHDTPASTGRQPRAPLHPARQRVGPAPRPLAPGAAERPS